MSHWFYITPEEYERAAINGVSANCLTERVRKYGWSKERAITVSVRKRPDRSEWRKISDQHGIAPDTFYKRIESGWDLERAATTPTHTLKEAQHLGQEKSRKYPSEFIEMAKSNGLTASLFYQRVAKGWEYSRAATQPRMSLSESGKLGKAANG